MSDGGPTVGEAAIRRLEAHGVDTVFGIPGVHTLAYYRGLAASPIRHVTPRHEQGAGFMADGFARAGGRPGVCILTSGPGVTNAATPLGQAYSDSSAVLVLSSVIARADLGLAAGRLHEMQDQSASAAPLVRWSRTALAASSLPTLIDRAFAGFAAARPRPVQIEVPIDVLDLPGVDAPLIGAPSRPGPSADAVERAARLCAGAARPVLLLGGGAVDAGAVALRLARRIGAIVVTTTAGAGIVAADDPASIGAALGTAPGRQALAEADLVIAAGTELAETDHWTDALPIRAPLIRIDIDLVELTDRPADVAILSDAEQALAALHEALPTGRSRPGDAAGRAADYRRRIRAAVEAAAPDRVPLVDALRAALPRDAILATDMTKLGYTANTAYPSYVPRSYLHPCGYGTLGFGLPAAIGAAIACPDRAVVAVMGDGGLQFTLPELATAAELGRPFILLVYDNGGYGMIRDGMVGAQVRPVGVDVPGPRLDLIAAAYGATFLRTESATALSDAVARCVADRAFAVIQVCA